MSDTYTENNTYEEENENLKLISTKANTLKALKPRLKYSFIEDMMILTVRDYKSNKRETARSIDEKFDGKKIVVRSSTTNEDCMKKSNAGHYKSVLDVSSKDEYAVINAIDKVAESYTEDMDDILDQQILAQRQADDVSYCGVLFTYDIQGSRPYYLINYDDGGSTDSVTSGNGGKTLWIARNIDIKELDTPWRQLLKAVLEVEDIFHIPLDIEFAINKDNEVIMFQVRPLVVHNLKVKEPNRNVDNFYKKIDDMAAGYESIKSAIDGKNMMFSDMAFWNPSEIIGTSPRTLDYSLYRYIITSRAWNEGLVPMGYRKLDDDLMYRIGNKPYISLEYSFYSLIPADLDEKLARNLVAFYSGKLSQDATAHDKIEFEIVYSSYDFNTSKRTMEMLDNGFTKEERESVITSLKNLTENAVKSHDEAAKKDREDIASLERTRKRIADTDMDSQDVRKIIGDVMELLEEITIYGTPQFTRHARMAFMSRAFCGSLSDAGWFGKDEVDNFMKSITTVSSEFEQDYQKFSSGRMTRADFNEKYGHLRSGTYDIRTDSYNQMVFRPAPGETKVVKEKEKTEGLDKNRLKKALKSIDLDITPEEFNSFVINTTKDREYFKFEFTKSLSLVLDLIQNLGKLLDIDRSSLSWISVEDLKNCLDYDDDYENDYNDYIRGFLNNSIALNKQYYKEYSNVILPDVILGHNGIYFIPVNEARPNFITSKKVEGEVVNLETDADEDLMDKIVMIPKADPGYEWIFTKGIKGFITKYGGMASHMAIRCAEFEIPAAIGCGEKIYNDASTIEYMELDCANGSIREGFQCEDLRALITQKEGINQYGDATDVLEAAYVRFYELLGFIPQPASNFVRNVGKLFERKCDLLIVSGGGVLPEKYYDRPHGEELQPHRDAMEEKLIRHCIGEGIPIIATCRGMQYINVLFGGYLKHDPDLNVKRSRGEDHEVYLCEEDRTIWVNNYHVDVVPMDGLAKCFKPLAIDTKNQTIEAFGSDEMKVLALQWHPERKFATANALSDTRKLVLNFIQKHIS